MSVTNAFNVSGRMETTPWNPVRFDRFHDEYHPKQRALSDIPHVSMEEWTEDEEDDHIEFETDPDLEDENDDAKGEEGEEDETFEQYLFGEGDD